MAKPLSQRPTYPPKLWVFFVFFECLVSRGALVLTTSIHCFRCCAPPFTASVGRLGVGFEEGNWLGGVGFELESVDMFVSGPNFGNCLGLVGFELDAFGSGAKHSATELRARTFGGSMLISHILDNWSEFPSKLFFFIFLSKYKCHPGNMKLRSRD